MNQSFSLSALLAGLLPEGCETPDLRISGLACDSRRVGPGMLFFAIPGAKQDGALYAQQALAGGAVAVVAARPLSLPVPCLIVPRPRRVLALAAARFHGEPSASLSCIGVTGTNGKTTVCHLLAGLMTWAGKPFGLMGTVGHQAGPLRFEAATTTPGPIEVQELLTSMVAEGLVGCAMEVSSHALEQERAAALRFRVGVFMNLSRDHLDYHGSMEAYARAKRRLFEGLLSGATAVANLADPLGSAMLEAAAPGVERIGFSVKQDAKAAVRARDIRPHPGGTRFVLEGPRGTEAVDLPLLGAFNLENALGAAAAAFALGLAADQVAAGLEQARCPPGRLEFVPGPPGSARIFIDYAHTPDALERVLQALRPFCAGRLLVLFGCGGERDAGKRPEMGRVAVAGADLVWITSDNPRGEKPGAIIEGILSGIGAGIARVRVEPDREAALRQALAEAGPEDTLLVAGKGHETGQIVAGQRLPFSDREVVRRLLWKG